MLHWGVYFIILSVVFNQLGTIDVLGLTLNQAVIVCLFALALFGKLFRNAGINKISALDIIMVTLGTYMLTSNYLVSPDPAFGSRMCTDFMRSLACYFLVVFLIDNPRKIKLCVLAYIVASVLMVFTANLFTLLGKGILFVADRRQGLTGLAGHYINFGIYSIMAIPLAYYFAKESKNSLRILFVLATVVLSLGALFSGSRGAIISFMIMLAAIVSIELRMREEKLFSRITLLAITSISLFAFFYVRGGESLIGTMLPGNQRLDPSLVGRFTFQQEAFSFFLDHPFWGIGINAFTNISRYKHAPHNEWLQVLTELGLFGMLLAAIVVYYVFSNLLKAKRKANLVRDKEMGYIINGIGVSTLTLLVWGFYENIGLITANKVLFMLFGLSTSCNLIVYVKEKSRDYIEGIQS